MTEHYPHLEVQELSDESDLFLVTRTDGRYASIDDSEAVLAVLDFLFETDRDYLDDYFELLMTLPVVSYNHLYWNDDPEVDGAVLYRDWVRRDETFYGTLIGEAQPISLGKGILR